jgi:hypothetical protein
MDSAAAKWLIEQPEVREWVFQSMRAEKLIAYDEGSRTWAGAPLGAVEVAEWSDKWPDQATVLAALRPGYRLMDWRKQLKLDGVQAGHWMMVHMSLRLMDAGLVTKASGAYWPERVAEPEPEVMDEDLPE